MTYPAELKQGDEITHVDGVKLDETMIVVSPAMLTGTGMHYAVWLAPTESGGNVRVTMEYDADLQIAPKF